MGCEIQGVYHLVHRVIHGWVAWPMSGPSVGGGCGATRRRPTTKHLEVGKVGEVGGVGHVAGEGHEVCMVGGPPMTRADRASR